MPHVLAPTLLHLDPRAGIDDSRKNITKLLRHVNLPPLVDSFDNILSKSNVKFRNTVKVDPVAGANHSPLCASTYGNSEDEKYLPSILAQQHAVVVGGAIVRHICLVVSEEPSDDSRFGHFPVLPLQIPEGQKSRLFSKELESGVVHPSILLFPEPYIAPPGFGNFDLFGEKGDDDVLGSGVPTGIEIWGSDLEHIMTKDGMKTATLELYTVSGDIIDFWGVRGLKAKLHKYKGAEDKTSKKRVGDRAPKGDAKEPAREVISIDARSQVFGEKPLAALFPFIDSEDFQNLPIANLELTYSEDKVQNPLRQPGLRLELDVKLEGCMCWVGDAIKNLFGTSKPPTIHLSALLSEERNWSRPPNIEKIVLQGYFKDMALRPWNVLDFKTLGIELTASKKGDSWDLGFGFIGEVAAVGIPEAQTPLKLSYRIVREVVETENRRKIKPSRLWTLLIDASEWKGIFGFKNIDMEQAEITAAIDEGHFSSSIRLDVLGAIRIGDSRFEVHGRFSKGWRHALSWTWIAIESQKGVPAKLEDHYIQASSGDLKLSDIRELYTQITGQEVSRDSQDSDYVDDGIIFRNMSIRICCTKYSDPKQNRKALELSGEVTVGNTTSYTASLTFATEGIRITGSVSNVKIPGTDIFIEKAGLRAFLALKGSKGRMNPSLGTGKEHTGLQVGRPVREMGSSFTILGVINYHSIVFRAGFHMATEKNSQERDWLVFGSAEHARLRDVWPSIEETSFLNLQLDNVAVVASSRDMSRRKRPYRIQSKNGCNNDTKAQVARKDPEDEISDGAHAGWDVLEEVEKHGYAVKKGFQICATIPSFQQLEHLNHGKKIEGLQLSLRVDTEGEIAASIQLPSSFKVDLSPFAYFSEFSASIGAHTQYGICLQLSATLTLIMEDSDPILVKGMVVGTVRGAGGALLMDPDSRWINPFNLNKELIVSNLSIEAGFDYATVLETGPTLFALRGQVNVGKYGFRMDVGVDVTKAAAVLRAEIAKLDVSDIATIAGKLIQDEDLAPIATRIKDIILFSDFKLYLSSGATFMGDFYPRGIQVRGKLTFFDEKGEFDGSLTDGGMVMKGGLDALKIGALEITSLKEYSGRKRAALDIEVTKTTQKVLIDGIVRFRDTELQVYVNADLQQQFLQLDIRVKLTDALIFTLQGDADIHGSESLENIVVRFKGHLQANIVRPIGEGIINSITALEHQAKDVIDGAEGKINEQLAQLNDELARQGKELEKLRRKSAEEVLRKREKIRAQNEVLRRLYDRIDEFEVKYQAAKSNKNRKEVEIENQMRKIDEAKAQLEKKKREMRKEYDSKIQEQRSQQAYYESERDRLRQEKESTWGDALRKGIDADNNWIRWCRKSTITSAVSSSVSDSDTNAKTATGRRGKGEIRLEMHLRTELGKLSMVGHTVLATIGLEQAHASKAIELGLHYAAESILKSDEFRAVERGIQDAVYEVSRFERALEKLITQGPEAYIKEMTYDERVKLDRQVALYDELVGGSKKLEAALTAARNSLDAEKGRLRPEEEAAREAIAELEAEIELKPFEKDYENKKQDFEKIKTQTQALLSTLEDVRKGIHVGEDVVRQVTKMLTWGMPEIRDIYVEVSSDAFVEDKPMLFSIKVRWLGQDFTCHDEWSPNQEAYELYNSAAKGIVALVDEW
ncbi:hypothetical protein F4805DRAFT_464043 [Annulohypoxylon moriforme]|nr:hypothetical protein F4805DRAFT_464043 [Annulohypoxylon moriforme]